MATPSTRKKLLNIKGCDIGDKLKYIDGHDHLNKLEGKVFVISKLSVVADCFLYRIGAAGYILYTLLAEERRTKRGLNNASCVYHRNFLFCNEQEQAAMEVRRLDF